MYRTEVRRAASDDHALEDARAAALLAFLVIHLIRIVRSLELAPLSFDISIVRGRVSAEVDAFLQGVFHGGEHEFHIFLRDLLDDRKRVHIS